MEMHFAHKQGGSVKIEAFKDPSLTGHIVNRSTLRLLGYENDTERLSKSDKAVGNALRCEEKISLRWTAPGKQELKKATFYVPYEYGDEEPVVYVKSGSAQK
jgi:hypothetical protein